MRKITVLNSLLLLTISILFLSCSASSNGEIKIVTAKSGLTLRESADLLSKKILTIPYKEKVHSIRINQEIVTVDAVKGHWEKIKWKNTTGWVFNAYLQPEDYLMLEGDMIMLSAENAQILSIESNMEFPFFKNDDITYSISFDRKVPQLQIKEQNKLVNSHRITDLQLTTNSFTYDDEKNIVSFNVQMFEPDDWSSGIAIYTVKFTEWSTGIFGFFITYMFISPSEGVPIESFQAIAIFGKRFIKSIWNEGSYSINNSLALDPYGCLSVGYISNESHTSIIFKDCETNTNCMQLTFDEKKQEFKLNNKRL